MPKNLFNSIQLFKPKRNVFDLTHDVKLSLDMGDLVPICCIEAVPGDKFQISGESLLRFAPLVAPVMHRMDVTMHYFFVPNRITFPDWGDFITGQADPLQTVVEAPTLTIPADADLSLADYFGLPVSTDNQVYNALPFAAYQKIYNEYYRDQNLISKVPDELIAGDNAYDDFVVMRKRAWEHDYFTSSLPFAQKGGDVSIPLGEVVLNPDWEADTSNNPEFVRTVAGVPVSSTGDLNQYLEGADMSIQTGADGNPIAYDPHGSLEVEATTINDLRRAFKLQEWLEKNARAGSRYVESVLAHFGVRSSDARLQRPEYITGVKSPVIISEVLNSTGEDGGLPQGNMAGHGISVSSGKFGSYSCEEHGYIIGIMSVMPKTAYMQGIPKHFLKTDDRYQFFWPEFANIGEQPVYYKELFVDHTKAADVFGYVPRYSEYKYMPSIVCGDFKTSLDYWHLARKFSSEPYLNQTFVECTPGKRIFAVEGAENSLYCHVLNKITAIRPMPKYGSPSF